MAKKTCSKGHIWETDAYGEECPFCPKEYQTYRSESTPPYNHSADTRQYQTPANKKQPFWLRIAVIIIAVAIGIIGGDWVLSYIKKEKRGSDNWEPPIVKTLKTEMRTVTANDGSCSIDIPVSFKPLNVDVEAQVLGYYSEEDGVGILIQREKKKNVKKTGLSNLTDYVNYLILQQAVVLKNFELLNSEPTTLNGLDAYLYKFNGTVEHSNLNIDFYYEKYYLDEPDYYYILQFSLFKGDEQEYANLIQSMAKSFKILVSNNL